MECLAPVLDPGRGRTKKGYFWAIARDDRPWGGTDPPAVAYTYAPGRGAVHALKLLDTYHGIVQCDGYAAYKNIANAAYLGDAITLAFCWAHLRRKFFEIAKGGSAPIASEALDRIALLYAIEKTIRGRSADERRAVRQVLVLALKTWLEEQLARVSAKSVIAEAIRYGLNHWDGLVRFLEDGRIELDTNGIVNLVFATAKYAIQATTRSAQRGHADGELDCCRARPRTGADRCGPGKHFQRRRARGKYLR